MRTWDGMADEDVLRAFTDGDDRDAAFHELVNRYEHRIYAICYRYFGNHADAEDATQDTFVSLMRRAHQFRGDARLSTFLYRVATNACHDLSRRRARRPAAPLDEDLIREDPDPGPTVEQQVEAGELAGSVQQALLGLDHLSRTLVILCALQGQSYGDVAAAFDLPVGTVKSRVFRARARLAELLAPVRELGDDRRDMPDVVPPSPSHPPGQPRGPPD